MKISAYLSPSRHGVYYFRWPLPSYENLKRNSIKLSLKTKCPDRAGDLARHLASCGRLVRKSKTLAKLRQDEIRAMVRAYFVKALDNYTERLNNTGWKQDELDLLRQEARIHEDGIAGFDNLSDQYLDIQTVSRLNEIAQLEADDVTKEDDIWQISITDDGDNQKRVKANASRRKFPVHSELIDLGFID